MPKHVEIIQIGRIVLCDGCNADFTASEEQGGLLFSSSAYCPACAPGMEASAAMYSEEGHIRARAKPGESFRDFVYRIRGGDGSAVTTITRFDSADEALKHLWEDK